MPKKRKVAHPHAHRPQNILRAEAADRFFAAVFAVIAIVGQHEVRFIGQDEELSVRHEAYSKQVFANGALKAAQFLLTKQNGLFSMDDLVNELLN